MAVREKKYSPETIRSVFGRYFTSEESEDGEFRAYCPICENPDTSKSPSASFNPDKGLWNCLSGNHGGSVAALVEDLKKERGFDLRSELMKARIQDPQFKASQKEGLVRAGRSKTPLPTAQQVSDWNERLLRSKAALEKMMSERGINEDTIAERMIGFDGDRYTIPVYEGDELVNVRRYKMNAARSQDKMLNIPGHGTAHLYMQDVLAANGDIVITEGEMDCLLLNQHGIPAVTHTAGASTFRVQWAQQFIGKRVWIAYDRDDTGEKGGRKVRSALKNHAADVFIITLPLEYKGADVTDYLQKEGHTGEDFKVLMREAAGLGDLIEEPEKPIAESGNEVSLMESMSPERQNDTLQITVSVAGKKAEPYTAPKIIRANCDMSKGAACLSCPISFKNGELEMELRKDSEDVYRFVDIPETRRRTLIKEITGARCNDHVEFEVPEEHYIEELIVQPSVDTRKENETERPVRRTAYSVGTYNSGVNEKIELVGQNVPDPKSGTLRFVAWENRRVDMDIDNFQLTPEMETRLSMFKPSSGQSPLDKCMEIAGDLAENVTHIYGRPELHVAYDLVYHSVQSFQVNDQVVHKGWLEAAVVGDTRTGKSEIANRMIGHYRAATLVSCEGMSFAGLVGGVQQIDGRWHMTWGTIPMNDRRMVFLDEVSGLAEKDVIEQMSSIRSSGIAQITKIQSEQISARTRLVWIMNPGDGSTIASKPGVAMDGLASVVPNAEDQARFDFVISAAKGEVANSLINAGFADRHEPMYSSEDCEALVKWAWSLGRKDIFVSEQAAKAAVREAMDLGDRYVSDPPYIQSENVRFKLLRIAAAIAARTFSRTKSGKLLVQSVHVKDAVRFLDMIYGSESMGYMRKSKRAIQARELAKSRSERVRQFLHKHDDVLLTLQMAGGNTFRKSNFKEFGGMTDDISTQVVKRLLEWRMIYLRSRGELMMDPILLSILREFEDEEEE